MANPQPKTTFRFEALDGWRGLAALAICFYHVPIVMPLQQLGRWENMELMVDLFLVLSGFVIAHSWGERIRDGAGFGTFVWRRFWRVWPMHVAMLAVLVLVELAKIGAGKFVALPLVAEPFTETRSFATLFSNLVLTQSMGLHGTTSWNLPSWSISVEFWTYMVFALVMLGARRRAALWFGALSLAGLAVLLAFSSRTLLETHQLGFFRALFDFFIGALAYHYFRKGTLRFSAGAGVELFTLALVIGYLCLARQNASIWLAPFMFALLIVVFAQSRGPVNGVLESRPVQALGLWSYSLYMLHDVLNYIGALGLQVAAKALHVPLEKHMVADKLRAFSTGQPALDLMLVAVLISMSVYLSRWTWQHIEKPWLGGPRRERRKSPRIALA